MPYGRKRYTRTRRTTTRRTRPARRALRRTPRTRTRNRVQRNRWENPIHQARSYKFKYADSAYTLQVSANPATQAIYKFAGNSPFDPDQSGAGVQPYGWDQITALYSKYVCFGSKIKVYFIPSGTETSFQVYLVPSRIDVPLTYTDASDLRQVPGRKMISYVPGGNQSKRNLIMNYAASRRILADEDRSTWNALTTADPASLWYWFLVLDKELEGNDGLTASIRFSVEITYYVRLFHGDSINES
nr:MAG: capsid protein [Cressdnaviricota sp.]